MLTDSPVSQNVDVLIICALYEEFQALISVSSGLEKSWQKDTLSGWTMASAVLKTPHGNLSLKATWQGFMGREQAIAKTAALIQLYPKIRCIAMCGICAGRRGKIHLGDVIFADRMWSYDAGKVAVEEDKQVFQGDQLQFKANEKILQRMQALQLPQSDWMNMRPLKSLECQENWVVYTISKGLSPIKHSNRKDECPNWSDVIRRLLKRDWINEDLILTKKGEIYAAELSLYNPDHLPISPEFDVKVAPIATGAQVTEDEGIFQKLAQSMRKVLGVDMEASGLAALGEALDVPVIVAKGVSDYGDSFKDDNYREFAARASAECLIKLILESADILLKKGVDQHQPIYSRDQDFSSKGDKTLDLILELANLFPTTESIRAIWVRAGGRNSEVENNPRSEDLWLLMWQKANSGARVSPSQLLKAVSVDYPNNSVISSYYDEKILWEHK